MMLSKQLNHKIWYLAWPMIISNISVPLLGLVDTAILGHLENAHYLAAVAVGSSILSILYWGLAFLRMGTTGLAAQAYGAKQHDLGRLISAQAITLAVGLGLLIVLLSPLIGYIGLKLVSPPSGSELFAASYIQIRILSAPALLVNFTIVGWLIGRQNTRWPLVIALTTNGINVGLDFLFIIGLNMKSDGAAIATVIAEYSGCCLAIWVLRQQLANIPGTLDKNRLWRWLDYRELLATNRHLFTRTLILLSSLAFFTAQGAQQGEVILAANTILLNLMLLTAYGLDGFANAAEALVGDAVGMKNQTAFMQTCKHCLIWSLATAGLFSLFFLLTGQALISIMTSLPAVIEQARQYLPWLIVLPLITVWSYLLDGIFIGATQTAAMQYTMMFSAGLIYLPCWYFTQSWGNDGLWLAFLLFNAARGVSLGLVFREYSLHHRWWQKNTVI
ncbi:MATE family efflux transporter [Oceanicoccus sp. KOV_DT_Chl]|uniref:MATE family efflux transporter n=1 Tax=Oceanicoccus sp. KOV_DT_Chl TaxID=1904639 RepID=UPI00190F0153|nr:MATE family efflux transporter [Oceanicoccus sp. KOV_DT_Chl]